VALLPASSVLRPWSREIPALIGVLALAFLVGYWHHSHSRYALLLAALPLLVVMWLRPHLSLMASVAVLPFLGLTLLTGGVQVPASDVLLSIAFLGALVHLLLNPEWRGRARDLRLILLSAAPFTTWLLVEVVVHESLFVTFNILQNMQLYLLPLLVGGLVIRQRRDARVVVGLFVVATLLLVGWWVASGGESWLTGNKNPVGQFLANAALLVFALASSWRWRLLLVPLVLGMLFVQSRGALVGLGVGIISLVVVRGLGGWRRTLAAVVPMVAVVVIGYQVLPEDVTSRSTDFSVGNAGTELTGLTAAQYSVRMREIYREEGWELIAQNPVFGVGPGNYRTGTPGGLDFTEDPHNVVIRTAGDLGYPGLITFGVLLAGTAYVAFQRRKVNPYATVAIAVQAAIITHSFLDVYWVRGTPVLAFLLIGMAVNRRLDEPRHD